MMTFKYILLIIIIIILAIIIIDYLSVENVVPVTGGYFQHELLPNRLILPDNTKFVIDGNNMIHNITQKNQLSVGEFKNGLEQISDVLSKALASHEVHIVIKNSENNDKKTYLDQIINISQNYPDITYHVAHNNKTKKTEHHLKGRDDFMTIYLSKHDGYIVSLDRFKDFTKFRDIKPFEHISIINGNRIKKEKIKPNDKMIGMDKPYLGNHINYKFLSHDELLNKHISNGDIIVDKSGDIGTLYLSL